MSGGNPELLEVHKIKMYNPQTGVEENLRKIDFEGDDIFGHDDIEERRSDGWIINGLTAKVEYRNALFEVMVAGNEVMSYVKVSDIGSYSDGQDLVAEVRQHFLEHFRIT